MVGIGMIEISNGLQQQKWKTFNNEPGEIAGL